MKRRSMQARLVVVGPLTLCGCTQVLGLDKEYVLDAGSGSGGTSADAGDGGCVPTASPATPCPPEMVGVPGGYCIDKKEVTWQEYLAWVPVADLDSQEPCCKSWNTDFHPGADEPANHDDHPVTYVDWCDAYAYCRGQAGKRLCGSMDHDHLLATAPAPLTDPCQDEWYAACSAWGVNKYVQGMPSTSCNSNSQDTVPAGSLDNCHSPDSRYILLRDMNGNVSEWEDACGGYDDNSSASTMGCAARGGSYKPADVTDDNTCQAVDTLQRDTKLAFVGFRCCM